MKCQKKGICLCLIGLVLLPGCPSGHEPLRVFLDQEGSGTYGVNTPVYLRADISGVYGKVTVRRWIVNGEVQLNTTSDNFGKTFSLPGDYVIQIEVEDERGVPAQDSVTVHVVGSSPVVNPPPVVTPPALVITGGLIINGQLQLNPANLSVVAGTLITADLSKAFSGGQLPLTVQVIGPDGQVVVPSTNSLTVSWQAVLGGTYIIRLTDAGGRSVEWWVVSILTPTPNPALPTAELWVNGFKGEVQVEADEATGTKQVTIRYTSNEVVTSITASGTGWTGDQLVRRDNTVTRTYAPGIYTFGVEVMDNQGHSFDTKPLVVLTVTPFSSPPTSSPTVMFTSPASQSVFEIGEDVTFIAKAVGGTKPYVTYNWILHDGRTLPTSVNSLTVKFSSRTEGQFFFDNYVEVIDSAGKKSLFATVAIKIKSP